MINQPIHILNQMGVIVSFTVAKKITEEDIRKFFTREKRSGKNETQIEKMLREKVLRDIQEAIVKQQIPGLFGPHELSKELGLDENVVKNLPELNRLIMVIANKLSEKKYDKMSLCYFVNGLVNILSLQESDFEKFHRQYSKDKGESSDEDGDDNDEESDTI